MNHIAGVALDIICNATPTARKWWNITSSDITFVTLRCLLQKERMQECAAHSVKKALVWIHTQKQFTNRGRQEAVNHWRVYNFIKKILQEAISMMAHSAVRMTVGWTLCWVARGKGHGRDKPLDNNVLRKTGATGWCVRSDWDQRSDGRNNICKRSRRKWDTWHSWPSEEQDRRSKKKYRPPLNTATHWTSSVKALEPDDPTAAGMQRWEMPKQWISIREFKDNPGLCWRIQITECKKILHFTHHRRTNIRRHLWTYLKLTGGSNMFTSTQDTMLPLEKLDEDKHGAWEAFENEQGCNLKKKKLTKAERLL